jgi:2-oxoglutarate ferredoxin oxidoreductase subunit delta
MTAEKKKRKTAKIDIFRVWCKSCGICVAFCPSGALGKNEMGQPVVNDLRKCTDCGLCEIRCPDFAISVGHPVDDKTKVEVSSEEGKEGSLDAGE